MTDPNSIDETRRLCADFGPALESLVRELIKENGITAHSISHRVKTKASLERKINRRSRDRASASSITDVLGIRVTTYFSDDVDAVASVIQDEFDIDPYNSIDKRQTLDPDRFGYSSLHFVASLSKTRGTWTEYRRFGGLKFEIQVRSILQHAWAEIEHDLGYKSEVSIPRSIRRRFSRLAGLLELGDEEFAKIRADLEQYKRETNASVDQGNRDIPLDLDSLKAWLDHSERAQEFTAFIEDLMHLDAGNDVDAGVLEYLSLVGVRKLSQLDAVVHDDYEELKNFSAHWIRGDFPGADPDETQQEEQWISRSISVFYICHLLAARLLTVAPNDDLVHYFEQWAPNISSEAIAAELKACLLATRQDME